MYVRNVIFFYLIFSKIVLKFPFDLSLNYLSSKNFVKFSDILNLNWKIGA